MKQHKFTSIATLTIALSLLLTAWRRHSWPRRLPWEQRIHPAVSDEKSTSDGLKSGDGGDRQDGQRRDGGIRGCVGADLVWYYKDSVLVDLPEREMTHYELI